jgi:hypothetical protein
MLGERKFLINQMTTGIAIQMQSVGMVKLTDIVQTGSNQLGEATKILMSFQTSDAIPTGSNLVVTLSNNFVFSGDWDVQLNNVPVTVQANSLAWSLTMFYLGPKTTNFKLAVNSGLRNPTKGPYRYNYLDIQFATADGFGIDGSLSKKIWIYQDCVGNCDICKGSLDTCTSCGIRNSTSYY